MTRSPVSCCFVGRSASDEGPPGSRHHSPAFIVVSVVSCPTVEEVEAMRPRRIVVSPGPGAPRDAGIACELIKRFAGRVPILGVCLGTSYRRRTEAGVRRRALRRSCCGDAYDLPPARLTSLASRRHQRVRTLVSRLNSQACSACSRSSAGRCRTRARSCTARQAPCTTTAAACLRACPRRSTRCATTASRASPTRCPRAWRSPAAPPAASSRESATRRVPVRSY
jgi:hypothetical protein